MSAPRLTTPAAARVLGVKTGMLHGWLHRKQFTPQRGYGGKWAEFEPFDICVMAIALHLLRVGLPVPQAMRLARQCVAMDGAGKRAKQQPERLCDGWADHTATAHQDKRGNWRILKQPKHAPTFPAPIFIALDVADVLRATFKRMDTARTREPAMSCNPMIQRNEGPTRQSA